MVFFMRLISSIIFIGLFLSMVLASKENAKLIFFIMSSILIFMFIFEVGTMLENIQKYTYKLSISLVGALFVGAGFYAVLENLYFVHPMTVIFALTLWLGFLFDRKNGKASLNKIFNSAAVIYLVLVPFFFLINLFKLNDGQIYFFFLVAVTKIGDIGAYAVGVSTNKIMNGNHKIIPSISPKKSWEGTIGGLICTVLLSLFFMSFSDLINLKPNLWLFIFIGAVLFIGGFLGDLTASSFKRICEVKDSGRMIPGIGGAFDLLDSLLINGAVFYYLVMYLPIIQPNLFYSGNS